MKKFLLLLSLIFCTLSAFAIEQEQSQEPQTNDINLELSQPKKTINLSKPNYQTKSIYDKTHKQQEIQDYSKQNPHSKRTAKFSKKKTFKDITIGTDSAHTTTSDTYNSSNTVYTEYKKNNFKLNSAYSKNTTPNQTNQDKGTLSVTPEYKLNKHVSVQNKYSANLNDNSNKGEVKINVKPFKDDRMDMGVGVGQKFSPSSSSSSQVNFSTNIRW